WFEPERVRRGTPLQTEHPEWLLENGEDKGNLLFDLGNDEARRYLTGFISGMIEEVGIDIYRQDFNFEPLTYWKRADEPDRVGMHEIRHIEGLYAFWDELRARHPNLLIDNCSSGGRRIDLETTSRSFPLWRSDYTDLPAKNEGMKLQIGAQAQTAGLSRWVPLHSASVWTFEPYDMRSSFSTGVSLYTDILADDYPIDLVKHAVAEVKRLRPYLLGDFYPLVLLTVEEHDWCAYQFDRPDLGTGCAIFLRRHESPYPSVVAGLRNIDTDARYEISLSRVYEHGSFHQIGAWDLKRLTVSIPTAPGSLLLEYRKRDG
ncbi:MAG TPA: alpha-galactosidase, partial [Firmicutes bacterium]|nr:alpha-galactosidase [Bacillota bacterium]